MSEENINKNVQYGESISFTPREIVSELDRFIIGQEKAKKAVAVALRNRWRRQQLPSNIKDEVTPKNILMVGQTGVGKTEIARRLAKLCKAPFLKVEATKFTEIGYVGRDVEQIIRDLTDVAYINLKKNLQANIRAKAELKAIEMILDILVGGNSVPETRERFRQQIIQGKMDDKEIEIEINDKNNNLDLNNLSKPGGNGMQMGVFNMADLLKSMGGKTKKKSMPIKQALEALIEDISEDMLDQDKLVLEVKNIVEQNGIVFIDEIDKICSQSEYRHSDVSREGVQRDLLPLIEGTTVSTKYGFINTDHILFIASGAFQVVKPSDLLPELQGRLPIRVELQPLTAEDFYRILKEPEHNILKQYMQLLEVEGITINFTNEAIRELAQIADNLNSSMDNIGARRLHAVVEKAMEELSFHADSKKEKLITIDADYIRKSLSDMVHNYDLKKFVL